MSITLRDIHFSYGRIRALDGVTLDLPQGAIGLLGPNGAGKSTLLRLLLGFLIPDRGEGTVLDYNIRTQQNLIRRYVGYMPEDDCFIPGMDAVSFTSYLGELSGMPHQEAMKRAHEVLFFVGLEESRYRLVETYSGGMKQRLKLAQAIVHDPKLILLDEPTSSLDPQGRKEILELIRDISSKKDIQVLVSSHILADIEVICSYVVILNRGKVAAQGRMKELKEIKYSLYELRIKGEKKSFLQKLEELGCRWEETEEGLLKLYMGPDHGPQEIFRLAADEKIQIRHLVKSQTSLEDLFAKAVGVD